MIIAEDVVKEFYDMRSQKITAVNGVSFKAEKGKILGILGPNGAGKTTLLRMIASILKPTKGKISVDGHDTVKDGKAVRSRIGFLSGGTELYNRLTIRETIAYFGSLYNIDKKDLERRAKEIYHFLGMEELLDRRCEKLSTGQRQKVSIARTIIHDPPILILDEPTSGLDVITSIDIMKFIKRARENNKCILYSTHYMAEAESLCDNIILLHKGKIIAEGSLESLKNDYKQNNLTDIFVGIVGQEDQENSL